MRCTGMLAGISNTTPALSPSHMPWMIDTPVRPVGFTGSVSRFQNVPVEQPCAAAAPPSVSARVTSKDERSMGASWEGWQVRGVRMVDRAPIAVKAVVPRAIDRRAVVAALASAPDAAPRLPVRDLRHAGALLRLLEEPASDQLAAGRRGAAD